MDPVVQVIHPSGTLDGTSTQSLLQEVDQLGATGIKTVLVNLQHVTFIDSSGLGALVAAFKAMRAAGGKLVLCSANPQARMLFELTSMDQVFEIFANPEEFQQTLQLMS